MLETFFEKRFVLERFRASPLGSHIDGFAASLIAQEYSFQAGGSCLRHAVHLGRWMEPRGLLLSALSEAVIASFVGHFPACDCHDERVGSHERALARVRVCSVDTCRSSASSRVPSRSSSTSRSSPTW